MTETNISKDKCFHLPSPSSFTHREQVQQVLVGLERRFALVDGKQLADVAVQVLQLAQVDFLVLQVIRQRLIQRDQVLEVDAQDGHLKSAALVVHAPVVSVVTVGREQLGELAQRLQPKCNIRTVILHL